MPIYWFLISKSPFPIPSRPLGRSPSGLPASRGLMLASPLLCGLLSTGGVPIHLPVLCLSLQGVKASPPRATGKKKITQLGCCQPSPVCQKREIKANKTSKGKLPKPPFGTQQLSKKTQGPQERGEPTPNENHSCCRCELHRQSRSQGVPGSLTTLAGRLASSREPGLLVQAQPPSRYCYLEGC